MLSRGLKKYLINPSLGLLPSVLYIFLFFITKDITLSLIVAILLGGIGDLLLRFYGKKNVSSLFYFLNFCALTLTFILRLFLHRQTVSDFFYLALYEILFASSLAIVRWNKPSLSIYLEKNKSVIQKTLLGEFFEVAQLAQYAITIHLFILLIDSFFYDNPLENSWRERLIYIWVPVAMMLAIIAYEEIKTRSIVKRLRKEEWLPIVSESGQVTGRIARSVSAKMQNRFLHPVVRIALIHNGEIYLQKRSDLDTLDPGTYDHPFEKYMLFNHEINITVRNSIARTLGMQELPFKFLLKYVFENDGTKRLIFLFVSVVENKEQLKSLSQLKGKFWTLKQIEEGFQDENVFSECFQLEFEYLKNTVILPGQLTNNQTNI